MGGGGGGLAFMQITSTLGFNPTICYGALEWPFRVIPNPMEMARPSYSHITVTGYGPPQSG